MIMRPLSPRERIIFIICLCVVGFFLLYRFGYQKSKEELLRQQERILKTEKDLRKHVQVVRTEASVDRKLNQYTTLLKQSASDEQEMTKILSDIEAVAGKINIKIINMEPEKIRKGDFYNYFSVSIQAQGSLKRICEFLYALETKTPRFRIDEMRVEKYSMRADDLRCQFIVSRFLIP